MEGGEKKKEQTGKRSGKVKKGMPHVFGIRHLSPAGAYYVREYLDRICPDLVLIEGPADFTELLKDLGSEEVRPPVAVMAYTQKLPIRTILYPFALYSPEYQAILWAKEHGCRCQFCDLPSEVFLGLEEQRQERWRQAMATIQEEANSPEDVPKSEGILQEEDKESRTTYVYRRLDELSEDGDQETFWERTMEHARNEEGYRKGSAEFGRSLAIFAKQMQEELQSYGTRIIPVSSSDEAIGDADLLITVTPSSKPVFDGTKIKKGCTISCVGAYQHHMQDTAATP